MSSFSLENAYSVPHSIARTRIHTYTHAHAHFFKVELEGLLELVACDCVLMRERLDGGDKPASLLRGPW